MKFLVTILLLCWSTAAVTASSTFNKLSEVNKCWYDQDDVELNALPAYKDMSETEWIRLHLSLVEQTLRARSTAGLTWNQTQKRLSALDNLHEYWMAGKFPQNENYSYRTPIFIDNHNTFCAVGYLVKASGHEAVSRMISAKTNLAYVKEMNYPELDQWAAEYGFTKDELAWIQPAYPPGEVPTAVGGGVDGIVYEMYPDEADGKLYIGGTFSNVDGSIPANSIAYVTENNGEYTWHSMGDGINGRVNAIVKHEGKIFIAGSFSASGDQAVNNVAYWENGTWHSLGCIYGTVYDLAVYKGELYACGSFDVCAAMSDVNVARWEDNHWQQIPGLSGRVNTMTVVGEDLVLGGDFNYQSAEMNIIRWNAQNNFQPYTNNIINEVMDIKKYGDTLYAACRITVPAQIEKPMMRLNGTSWIPAEIGDFSFFSQNDPVSFNTLCVEGDNMMIGGNFHYNPGVGIYGENCVTLVGGNIGSGNWFLVDSAIYKMVRFNGQLFAGGKFKYAGSFSTLELNGIARRTSAPTTGIVDREEDINFSISPNPIDGSSFRIENDFGANQLIVTDISGRTLVTLPLKDKVIKQQVSLPHITPGVYILGVSNEKGARIMKKVVVK